MKKLSLREIQLTELALVAAFDEVTRKYGLKYTLCAGSLIGAVRHKGFIPWDDDIDISMPRPDYEKLVKLNEEKELWPSNMLLASYEAGNLGTPFMKLFDTDTSITEENYDEEEVASLWIDIFPVDGLPGDEKTRKKHYRKALNLCRLNMATVVRFGYGSSGLIIILKELFMKPVAKLLGRKRICAMQKKHAYKYPYEKSNLCGMVTWAYDGPGQALTRKEYEDLIELPFEDLTLCSTSAWDKYLTGVFGDYMTPPPEDERVTHDMEAYRK